RSSIGKAQHAGIKLAAHDGLDEVGARLEFDQFHIQPVLLVEAALIGSHDLGVVHDAQIADLEFLGGDSLAGKGQGGQGRQQHTQKLHTATPSRDSCVSETGSASCSCWAWMPSRPRISRRMSANSDRSWVFSCWERENSFSTVAGRLLKTRMRSARNRASSTSCVTSSTVGPASRMSWRRASCRVM